MAAPAAAAAPPSPSASLSSTLPASSARSPASRSSPFPSPSASRDRAFDFDPQPTKPASPPAQPPQPASSDTEDAPDASEAEAVINMDTFQQILELEEDDGFEFSAAMAQEYFGQVITTFGDMDAALADQDLKRLSDLGHFLKGSSAALGVSKVQRTCARMQNYGLLLDDNNVKSLAAPDALARITVLISRVKGEYAEAESFLRDWYAQKGIDL